MIPPTQREALSVFAEVVDLYPDIRLGQLFAHLGFLGEDQTGRSLWNIDDEQLLAVLYHHRTELTDRLPDSPSQQVPLASTVSTGSHGSTPSATPSSG